jgi:5,10-methylenetetrahydromethanopterin reductase
VEIAIFVGPIPEPSATLEQRVARIAQAERDGFGGFWLAGAGLDPLVVFALAGRETSRIELGTAVVQAFTRHPLPLAQQALTAQIATGGRLALGVGPSHAVAMERLGISYARAAARMREHLIVLRQLLSEGRAEFDGEHYTAHTAVGLSVGEGGATPVPLLISALAPRMLAIAGELADGTATWMAGPRTLEQQITPLISEAARAAGRPAPRILAGVGVAVTDGSTEATAAARAEAERHFGNFPFLPAYARVIEREGAASPGALAVIGSEAEVRAGLQRLVDAGATEILAAVIPFGDDAEASRRHTEQALAGMLG